MPYPKMYQLTGGGPSPEHEAARSLFLDAGDLPTAEAIVEHVRASIAPLAVAQLLVLGGAMALAAADSLGMAAAPEASGNVFRREGEYWTVVFDGSVVRLRDAKGLRHLARLLAHPGREFHATDLEAAQSRPSPAAVVEPRGRAGGGELAVRPDLGDAGTLLDATAKAAYRARLGELRAELEEAEGFNDPVRAAKARHELEFVVGELARAVGLGGRDRRAASHAERARLNATRAIRAAMANLARDNPALGRHLATTIRTGLPPRPACPDRLGTLTRVIGPGLNTGAPGLNAHSAMKDRRGRGEGGVVHGRGVPGKWPATISASTSSPAHR
jgi:hypothetical protein